MVRFNSVHLLLTDNCFNSFSLDGTLECRFEKFLIFIWKGRGSDRPGCTSPNPRHLAVWLCRWLTGGMAEWRARREIVYVQLCGWLTGCDWFSVVYNKNKYTSVSSCSKFLQLFFQTHRRAGLNLSELTNHLPIISLCSDK